MFEQPEFLLALLALGLALAAVWLSLELGFRLFLELPLRTDFYSSLDRDSVRTRQEAVGLRVASGPGWVHLGWVADPDREQEGGEDLGREGEGCSRCRHDPECAEQRQQDDDQGEDDADETAEEQGEENRDGGEGE